MAASALDMALALLQRNAITRQEYAEIEANYRLFVSRIEMVHVNYPSQWVATLDGDFFHAPSYRELIQRINNLPKFRYAYIEQIL